jgi:hypothetical protein
MTYTVGIPLDGQSLGNSKPQVRANFSVLFNYVAINHIALNALGAGKHFFVEMPNQSPLPTTIAAESGLTSAAYGPTPFANWLYLQESGGSDPLRNMGAAVQMTGIVPSAQVNGWTFLPGGLLMQWGNVTTAGLGNMIVMLNQPFQNTGAFFNVQLTLNQQTSTATNLAAFNRMANQFTISQNGSNSALSVFWLAIGFGA